ncbi:MULTISPECIES: FusB/FusC family EF-G-binding protein [Lysinibacillus]|uniref:Elongation factor G-binding protein n=1 Tax=Lysinibacillus antri TaxID=2498145 RepID=A0A432LD30_9BACI|nr:MULTISPECIES: FusB/FusC family EF-G-binding protein [Lysinibacillus]RUL53571.1 elongation factor G-binding protein [Lysinibacillus antri]TSI06198.1 elongation factor G-binding protein [Lysinibacillus sp. BW-2-10]
MEFITTSQYQLVKKQAKKIVNAFTSSKDQKVIDAIQALVQEEINDKIQFHDIEQQLTLQPIFDLKTKEQAEQFIQHIKPYVIPFQQPTENELKKLFPKDKKLKLPKLAQIDWQEISYLSWFDSGTNRKYLVYREEGVLKGVRGVFSNLEKVGICTVCNRHAKVGLLLVSKSGNVMGTYTKRGNYICEDSDACNEALSDLNKFYNFVENLKS